jgi:hypothetical protein
VDKELLSFVTDLMIQYLAYRRTFPLQAALLVFLSCTMDKQNILKMNVAPSQKFCLLSHVNEREVNKEWLLIDLRLYYLNIASFIQNSSRH